MKRMLSFQLMQSTESLSGIMKILQLQYLFIGITILACNSSPKTQGDATHTTDPQIDKLIPLDVNLGEPQPSDWLAVHDEPGQTFAQYIQSKPVTPSGKQTKIYLQPVGKFSPTQETIMRYTAEYLEIFFNRETVMLPILGDAIVPMSDRRLLEEGNIQFLTGTVLNYLERHIPEDAIMIMAITSNDLYPGDDWNFVFGQARLKQRVGVSSMFRYCDASTDSTDYSTCLGRMIKTSSHELNHMLSCKHCTHAVCVMNGSNSLWESDSRPNRLCSECLKKLQWNVGFDLTPRLEKMKQYFAKHKLKNDYHMAVKDLQTLSKD